MLSATAVAALFAVPLSSLPARADDAASVIAKHAAFVGRPDGVVLTYNRVSRAASSADSAVSAIATTFRRGPLYREVDRYEGTSTQDGFTGRAFWSSNANGFTVVDYEDAGRRMLTENIIEGNLLDDVPARLRDAQTIDGVAVDVVRFTPPSGIVADVAFDRATGAYVQVTYDPERRIGRSSTVRYGKYTEIAPGVRVPSSFGSGNPGSWLLAEHAVRAVTNDDLRGPTPTAKWDFASTDTTRIEIVDHPAQYSFLPRGQAVHVRATVNGKPGTFLLDSGASDIIVYRPYADSLGLTSLGRTEFSGVNGGTVAARVAKATSIQVGKNTLSNVIVTVAPPVVQDTPGKPEVDGILGYDFLAGAIVDVDLAAQTIRFLDPNLVEPKVGPGAYAFTVNLASHQPEIALKINNVTTRAIFDSGDDFLAMLSDDLRTSGRVVALQDKINAGGGMTADYQMSFMGVDGPSNVPARCSRLNEIQIGPYRYQNVETCFGPADVFGKDGGLIGFDFLRHFNWTFDYPESKLVLTPNGK